MNDQDAKFMILAGLPSEYGHTRQIIRGKSGMNMNEVRSLLLSAEYEIELKNKANLSSLSTMIAQCGSVCPASQNVQFSMPSNIPQIQGLYNCGYMNGNPVSFCLPIYVAAQSQSMCSPSGVLLNNNNLGSGNYFSNARAYSYAPQISKSMNQNGRSENGGYSFVQSNMLSSVGNHGVTQNGINLFASSGLTNVHQYNTSPATTQYGFVSPHNTMNASTGFATPPTSASSPTSSDIVPQNGRFMGVPSSPSFQPIFTSGVMLFNGSKQLQTNFQNYNAGFGEQNGDNASQPPSDTECDDYFARCLTDEMDDLKEYSGHAAEPCVINPVLTDPSYMDKPSLLLTQAQIDRIKLRDSISVAESGKFHKGGVRSLKTYEAGLETRPITSIQIPKALSASIFTQPVPPSIASQLSSCLALPDNNFSPTQVITPMKVSLELEAIQAVRDHDGMPAMNRYLMSSRQACASTNLWQSCPLIPPG
uniref:uncharacterized protein LOC101296574 n=1 Tax=Fragaria vesca subsp. vesca TaxID=101020 RepID=UPI0005C93396|nr:PREDICTED: uncharacterized protein LOC101296574 [Fragaria vesca subsp. vesca]